MMMPLPFELADEPAEEPSAGASIAGSTTGSAKEPANAVVAASDRAAASAIDFIMKILQIKKSVAFVGKVDDPTTNTQDCTSYGFLSSLICALQQ
jgi:hypothetical protein